MAEKVPQNLANHARFDPPFHFFVAASFCHHRDYRHRASG